MPDGASVNDRAKHLEFIQTVVARMAAASGLAKAWCLTVATAALGYAVAKDASHVAWLAAFAVLMFGLLDARYLREERKFRCLYEDARQGRVELFDMRTKTYGDRKDPSYDRGCRWWSVVRSWSQWSFYGPILLVAVLILAGGRNFTSQFDRRSGPGSPAKHGPSDPRSSESPGAKYAPGHRPPTEGRRGREGATQSG